MAKFYEWDSEADFILWHDAIMAEKGIPDEVTTAYTIPMTIEGKIIATVDDEDAEGLVETELRPIRHDEFTADE